MVTTMTLSAPCNRWVYQCDDIVVAPHAHRLDRGGHPIPVEPKAYAVLVALLEQAGTMIDKDTLLDIAWGHRNVTPGVLSRVISQLRHAMGDSSRNPRYIATVNCLGYRFIGKVNRQEAPVAAATVPLQEPTRADMAVADARLIERRRLVERRSLVERRAKPRRDAS